MADFQVTSGPSTGEYQDTRWRVSAHGEDSARPGQLDPSKFTSGTHYNLGGRRDNVIPSGVAVGKLTAGGLFGPYDASATDGREVLAGYINDNAGVDLGGDKATAKPTFALLVHGIVNPALLPVTAQRAAVATATTTGTFTYVEG